MRRLLLASLLGNVAAALAQAAETPQSPTPAPPVYDRIEAGREAYQRGEQERLGAIGQQRAIIDRNAWLSGGVTLYPYPSVESVYARGYGYARPRACRSSIYPGYATYPAVPGVFEPWPVVPGYIWGYPYVERVRQPIGHEVVRTPTGSFYRPVYALPQPAQTVVPQPAVDSEAAAPRASNRPAPLPTPDESAPSEDGLREF